MRRYGKVTLFMIAVCALVSMGFLAMSAINSHADNCKVPSINSKLCYDPTNNTDCSEQSEEFCASSKSYTINSFPNGTDSADEGVVKEVFADCYKVANCKWNDETDSCETGAQSAWYDRSKTVENDDMECSEE